MIFGWSTSELLYAPWVQSGLAPLLAAVICAYVSSRLIPRFSGITFMAGVLLSAALMGSLTWWPQAPIDKIIAVAVMALAVGLLIDSFKFDPIRITMFIWIPALGAAVWLLWPVLLRRDVVETGIVVLGLAAYTSVVTVAVSELAKRERAGHAYHVLFSVALGTGLACWFAAQPLMQQLATTAGAAALGALIPIAIAWLPAFKTAAGMAIPSIEFPLRAGQSAAIPGAFLVSLIAVFAKIHADLPWICFALLIGAPIAALFSPSGRKQFGLTILVGGILPLLFAIACAYFALRAYSIPIVAVPAG